MMGVPLAPLRWQIGGEWRAQPGRALVAVLAIAVGVALGLAVQLVNGAALGSFGRAMASVTGQAELIVRASTLAGLDEAVYPQIARLPGVAAASPVVELPASFGQLGRPGMAGNGRRFTLLGLDPLRAMAVTPGLIGLPLSGARQSLAADQVWLSPALQRAARVRPGQPFTITAAGRAHRFIMAGTLAGAGADARLAVVDIADAQWRFGQLGRVQRLDVRLAAGADKAAVEARLARLLPASADIATPAAEAGRGDALSRAYRVNLGMLALVALLTGGFLVWSAQALSVARRRGQFALLRVLGLPTAGLVAQVLAEALVLGLLGAALGLGLGWLLADLVVSQFGGDLGGGYFDGARPRLQLDVATAALFAGLGLLTAMLGSLAPALNAARARPAVALKGVDDTLDPARQPRLWPAALLLAAGALAALGPPIMGLPLLGYAAMALLLAGGIALMPWAARALLAPLAARGLPMLPADLAVRRLWAAPGAAALALSGIVASTALMVAMAVMVASFRTSVDEWVAAVLPADIYLHLEAAEAGGIAPMDQARLAAVPGVAALHWQRNQPLRLAPGQPAVQLLAQAGAPAVPIIRRAIAPAPAGAVPVLVSEPMAWLYGWQVGQLRSLPLAGQARRVYVAGVWRDYARQFGAVIMPMPAYQRLTGDASATEAAVHLAPGARPDAVVAGLRAALPAAVRGQALFGRPGEMRRLAMQVFDRSFAVTYALEIIAIGIGLMGVATNFSATTLARAREFGMLRHIGVSKRQVLAMLGWEGAGLGLVGALAGVGLGLVMAQVLIHVVNPQSFHWTMDTVWPWGLLAGLMTALVLAAAGTAVLAGRRALGQPALLAVRADW